MEKFNYSLEDFTNLEKSLKEELKREKEKKENKKIMIENVIGIILFILMIILGLYLTISYFVETKKDIDQCVKNGHSQNYCIKKLS